MFCKTRFPVDQMTCNQRLNGPHLHSQWFIHEPCPIELSKCSSHSVIHRPSSTHSVIQFNPASGPYVFDVRIMKKNSKSQSPYIYKIYLWFRHNKKQSKITKFRCVWCQDNEIAIRLERQKFQIFAVMSGREKNGEAKLYPHILGKPKPLQDEPWQRRNLSISMQ